jgi:hypothetical protein
MAKCDWPFPIPKSLGIQSKDGLSSCFDVFMMYQLYQSIDVSFSWRHVIEDVLFIVHTLATCADLKAP